MCKNKHFQKCKYFPFKATPLLLSTSLFRALEFGRVPWLHAFRWKQNLKHSGTHTTMNHKLKSIQSSHFADLCAFTVLLNPRWNKCHPILFILAYWNYSSRIISSLNIFVLVTSPHTVIHAHEVLKHQLPLSLLVFSLTRLILTFAS